MAYARRVTPAEEQTFKRMLQYLQAKKATKNIDKLRCVIYARKSKIDETETSISSQIQYCKEFASSCNLLNIVDILSEDNKSGFEYSKRAEFNKLIEKAVNKTIDVVICYSWDRFARNIGDAAALTQLLSYHHVYVLTGDDMGSEKSATTKMFQEFQWMLAEYQVRSAAENTKDKMLSAAMSRSYVCGNPPLGYRKSNYGGKGTKNIEIDINESKIVSEVFRLVAEGKTLRNVAKQLNDAGYKTKQREFFYKRSCQIYCYQ